MARILLTPGQVYDAVMVEVNKRGDAEAGIGELMAYEATAAVRAQLRKLVEFLTIPYTGEQRFCTAEEWAELRREAGME